MKIEKVKSPDFDLSNLEKYIFNMVFVIILTYIFSVGYYKQILTLRELNGAAVSISFFMMAFLILSRILSYQNKSALICEEPNFWSYYKGNRKISFELSEISSIKKSFYGLYSSFVIKIKDTQIRIPAETPNLSDFINDLSEHLSNEQKTDFMKFHYEALCVWAEMEKSSIFLRYFCFFIPALAFFTAINIWASFSIIICIIWVVLSLVFPLIWTAIHWLILKNTVQNFAVFTKVSQIWTIAGILLYMIMGTGYREFYLWMFYLYQG